MDPVEDLPPWVPEDDLLLKNAVEAGASLESLAKGAVRFSRRYSVAELRDRWRSLLYDGDVSAAASVSMANLELSRANGSGAKEGSNEGVGGGKKKFQSLRKQFHAMRKRLRRYREGWESSNNAFCDDVGVERNGVGCEGNEGVLIEGNLGCDVGGLVVNSDSLVGYGVGVGSMMWKSIEGVSVPDLGVQVGVGSESHGSQGRRLLSHGELDNAGEDVADSLLDLPNSDGGIIFMDLDDGKDVTAVDKPCCDNVDSLLVSSSPCEIQGNNDEVGEVQKKDAEAKPALPSGSSSAGRLEVAANPSSSSHGDQNFVSDSGNDVGLSAAAQNPSAELSEVYMICVLNTEDPDVPCNEFIDVSIVASHRVALKPQPIVKEVGYLEPGTSNQRRNETERNVKKEDNLSHSFTARTVIQGLAANVNSCYTPVGVVPKAEIPGRNSIAAVSSNTVNVNVNPSDSRSVRVAMMPASDGHLKQEGIDAPASLEVYAHAKADEGKDLPKSEAKSISLNQEEGNVDDNDDDDDDDGNDNDDYDSDNEIPYFSDVETMILEMDLSPNDQDANAGREALRYQLEETRRTIMRLEQSTQSSSRRAIRSRGAFAVLYGRILKKYIKKSEVILGRATDDIPVDVDLSKEGRANKISRRQALIKMEANGSFIIKNLGKGSFFLNGKEVASGQVRGLGASSVIEIRGISLNFEINNKCVRKFLENENERRETAQ
ncbi:hypothetical protein RJT34_30499 [Clitoria ternatea]|uniref:FHA domain-containing protein n=1 Tax=Clitoria ternatea TaxID=43366 RepID=A0AAN9ETH1_CLITE